MNESDLPEEPGALRLSSLLDGEVPPALVGEACRAWRADPQLRADWHTYSLIGDVLRSGDLAQPAKRDLAFLQGVRQRLALEAVVLAPQPDPALEADSLAVTLPASEPAPVQRLPKRRQRWAPPVGIAAGIAMVAGLAWTMRPSPDTALPALTLASAPTRFAMKPTAPEGQATPAQDDSAQLAPYLNAHRLVPGKAAFGPTPGFMRSVAHDPAAR